MTAEEEYKIYKPSKLQTNQLLNDKFSFKSNHLYKTAIDINIYMGNQ